MDPARQAILILGMHRSGTSALTRVLNLRGAALPEVVLPANAANAAGYWEPAAIVSLHDRLLAEAGSAWDDPSEFPREWFETERGRAYVEELARTIGAEYGDATLLVVKDPRACRLVPLWSNALQARGVAAGAVLVIRHPLEVAASLGTRDGMPERHALLMWLEHVLAAEADTRPMPRVVVTYEQLLADWAGCCDRIESSLGIRLRPRSADADQAIAAFLEPSLRHAALAAGDLTRPGVPAWVPRVYEVVEAAARGQAIDTAALEAVRQDMRQASAVFRHSLRWLANRAWSGAHAAWETEQRRLIEASGRAEAVRAFEQRVHELEGRLAAEQARSADVARQAEEAGRSRDSYRARLEALEATWLVRLQKAFAGRQAGPRSGR